MNYSEAVNAVFDKYPGRAIAMPALVVMALNMMGVLPADYQRKTRGLNKFLRTSKEFIILSGKYGGVRRFSDMTPEQVKEYRKQFQVQKKVREINAQISALEAEKDRIKGR